MSITMGRHRNILQKKEHGKTLEKELNETEMRNMPDNKFKVIFVKMFSGLETRVEELSFKKEKT